MEMDQGAAGWNVQMEETRPRRMATMWPSGVQAALWRSLTPSPASLVTRPEASSSTAGGLNHDSGVFRERSILPSRMVPGET